ADVTLIDLVEKLGEGDFLGLGALAGILEQREQREQQRDNDNPEGEIAQIGVHAIRPLWASARFSRRMSRPETIRGTRALAARKGRSRPDDPNLSATKRPAKGRSRGCSCSETGICPRESAPAGPP